MKPSVSRFALLLVLAGLAPPAAAATYLVNSASDSGAATDCPGGGNCTLRAAILAANANPGADQIFFGLPQNTTITPVTQLPSITDPVTIDARPDPAYDGHPWVYLDGLATSDAVGLILFNGAAGSAVYGLGFVNWDDSGIRLGGNAHLVTVDGCYFGRNAIGSTVANGNGIVVLTDSNTIGKRFVSGAGFAGAGNLVVGSTGNGILINGDANLVYGNSLGGTIAQQGNGVGIQVLGGNNNAIGRSGPTLNTGGGNVVVHSAGAGIQVNGNGNAVRANYVGTSSFGGSARPNLGPGIVVSGQDNLIGGPLQLDRNVVVNNQVGILLGTPGSADGTQVLGNLVQDSLGTGIRVQAGIGNLIEDNTSAGNGTGGIGDGIRLDGDFNVVRGNRIGFDGPNFGEGIFISSSATDNTVGPDNLIHGNAVSGVKSEGARTTVIDNSIGMLDAQNASTGVWLTVGADASRIEGNAINANGGSGIVIDSDDNEVIGNSIGATTGNANQGVRLRTTASGNDIGPDNVIGGNKDGVMIEGSGNRVVGNLIGATPDGDRIGEDRFGIWVLASASGSRIESNLVESSGSHGILVEGPSTLICGNEIGGQLWGEGVAGRGNEGSGIFINGADDTRLDLSCGINLVALNSGDGLAITNASGTWIEWTLFHSNALSGVALLGGAQGTVVSESLLIDNGSKAIHVGHNAGEGNAFSGNHMRGNAVPGIDLLGEGRTPNDPGDADEGPNRIQNTPVLHFTAPVSGGALEVGYSVDTDPANASYPLVVQFFIADTLEVAGEPTPSLEGRTWLGSATYAAPGVATAIVGSFGSTSSGWLVATARDADFNTSEFSEAIAFVVNSPTLVFADGFED